MLAVGVRILKISVAELRVEFLLLRHRHLTREILALISRRLAIPSLAPLH